MGLLNLFNSLFGKGDIIAKALKLLDGNVNEKNLTSVFSTYLLASKLAANYTDANSQADSFAKQVNTVVNLLDCSDYNDVVSKLKASGQESSSDLAYQLNKAINLIRSIG